jgi:3-phenylpropionate/trans-cinnamate dioxygenase ferredoxin reductase subunit
VSPARAVVVGASLAGLRAAEALRRDGHDGPLTVIGDETHAPYDRPPLSKQLLTGKTDVAGTALSADADLDIQWRLGTVATGLDLDRRVVSLRHGQDAGEELAWDRLVIATGSHARRLPVIPEGDGVQVLRSLDDAVALRAALTGGSPRLVIVGAGVIGLEVASSARAIGLDVTVLEYADLPLLRVLGPVLGAACARLHRAHGVDLRLGVQVEGLVGSPHVEGVRLAGGEVVPADVVVVGVGAAPNTAWLEGSGVDLDDGVRSDSRLRVLAGGHPLPDVVAAGDVARWDLPGAGPTRLEHWTNAVEQAQAAAAVLLRGDEAPEFTSVPYVWSDQHGRKLQVVGLPAAGDEVAILDEAADEHRLVAAYGRDGRLVAAAGFSRPARVMALRRLIEAGGAFPPEQ